MNEDEARMVTGTADARQTAAAVLARGVKTVVLKLGPRGCAIYTGGCEILCPAFEVAVKDTTGAGDCFVAGFLAAHLRCASLAEAGLFANAVGAFSVQCVGASKGLRTYDETERWIRETARGERDIAPPHCRFMRLPGARGFSGIHALRGNRVCIAR